MVPSGGENMKWASHILSLSILAWAGVASAQEHYWVGTSGNWSNTANWSLTPDGPSGGGVPQEYEHALLTFSDAIDREVTIDAGTAALSPVTILTASSLGTGSLTLRLDAGAFASGNNAYLGYEGQASFIQGGGTYHAGRLQIAGLTGGNGSYFLRRGALVTDGCGLAGYDGGHGAFTQTGGSHQAQSLYLSGDSTYDLSGGQVTAAYVYVESPAIFTQTGGS